MSWKGDRACKANDLAQNYQDVPKTNAVVVYVPPPSPSRGPLWLALASVGGLLLLLIPPSPWQRATPTVARECGVYTAAGGEQVRRPCGDWRKDDRKPAGATARCGDGTWSYSRHPRASGTCSGHGGKLDG